MSSSRCINVDITTDIVIARPADVVSSYAADPSNAPRWYENIHSVEWKTPPPLQVGSQVEFVASREPDGSTRMTSRNRAEPAGFATMTAPTVKPAMRRANRKDPAKLKALLESQPA